MSRIEKSPVFEFDRYINGQLMAEGVTIEKQPDLVSAIKAAVRIASRGPNGEGPVLVLNPSPAFPGAGVREEIEQLIEKVIRTDRDCQGCSRKDYAEFNDARIRARNELESAILSALSEGAGEEETPLARRDLK